MRLLTVLTLRMDSARFPGKVLAPVTSRISKDETETQPLAIWIVRRLRMFNTIVTVATTDRPEDKPIIKAMEAEGIPCYTGPTEDVISRVNMALEKGAYKVDFIFRMLGDCPFLETYLVDYAVRQLYNQRKEAFVYHLDPERWPVYGSREFPYSVEGWQKIVKESPYREHPDKYFHKNRQRFDILYHLPPPNIYFRPYRLEVDYPRDLTVIKRIASQIGMLAPLSEVLKYLDRNPSVALLNQQLIEKSGPTQLATYANADRRTWLRRMIGQPVMTWDGTIITPVSPQAVPVFCKCGHPVGQVENGRLYLRNRTVIMEGYPRCTNCGLVVKDWKKEV